MTIVHLAPGIGLSSYGVGAVVLGVAKAQSDHKAIVECWSLDSRPELEEVASTYGLESKLLRGFETFGPRRLGYSPTMERWARENPPDVIHQHMLWMATSRIPKTARSAKKSLVTVIAAHGALDQWALKQSAIKKTIARILFEAGNLEQADCFHATSDAEVQDFLRLRYRKPIAHLENGVPDWWLSREGNGERFRRNHAVEDGARVMLYMSRITPKKNLPFLIEVLEKSSAFKRENWRLVVVGDWNSDYGATILDRIQQSPIKTRVLTMNPLWGQEKVDALAGVECIVLPSLSEGNPMILMEGLAASLPVIVGNAEICPALKSSDCGWEMGASTLTAVEVLDDMFSRPPKSILEKGKVGRNYVAQHRTWSSIAPRFLALYEWLRGIGSRPSFVVT